MCCAVAFKIYDLKDTGVIEKDEVKRLLVQLLQDNPAIDLTDDEIDAIVEQVMAPHAHLSTIDLNKILCGPTIMQPDSL